MKLSTIINQRMHAGTACPTNGSLGECAAIWVNAIVHDRVHCAAAVYLWSAAEGLPFADVAAWFTQARAAAT
jgi:hypothetical protein